MQSLFVKKAQAGLDRGLGTLLHIRGAVELLLVHTHALTHIKYQKR
jgi:hypothetical protein